MKDNNKLLKREFIVCGRKPAYSKNVNDFIVACDLGTDGAFVKFAEKTTVTCKSDVANDQLKKQSNALRQAYKSLGCVDIVVIEIKNNDYEVREFEIG